MNIKACRSCGASVVWAAHARSGKPAPLDAEPTDGGNCVLTGQGTYTVLGKADERDAARRANAELRTNHFQTCPDAKDWKRSWPLFTFQQRGEPTNDTSTRR